MKVNEYNQKSLMCRLNNTEMLKEIIIELRDLVAKLLHLNNFIENTMEKEVKETWDIVEPQKLTEIMSAIFPTFSQ